MKSEQLLAILVQMGIERDTIKDYKQKRRMQIPCPLAKWFHEKKTDNKPSMSIKYDTERVTYKCFACKETGKLWQLADSLGRLRKDDSILSLAERLVDSQESLRFEMTDAFGDVDKWFDPQGDKPTPILPRLLLDRFMPWRDSPRAIQYLRERRVSIKHADFFDLCVDPHYNRIVCPVYNEKKEFVGAQGRYMQDPCPEGIQKYFNYFHYNKASCLGGIQFCNPDRKKLDVVEGFFDVLRICEWCWEEGRDVVTTFGSEVSLEQGRTILSLDKRTVFWYDNDIAGNSGYSKCTSFFNGRLFHPVERAELPIGIDPGKLENKEQYLEILRKIR